MKKIIVSLSILSLTIFALLYYYIIPTLFGETVYLDRQNIPEPYKNYPFLDSLISNSKYKVISFKSTNQELADKINDSIICISTKKKIENNSDIIKKSWYKINQLGIVTDSLNIIDKVGNEEIYQKRRYIINTKKDYYLTWMLDGDTLKKPFALIEKGNVLEKEAYLKYRKDSEFSTSDYIYDSITSERVRKTFYFKNDRWSMIYSKKPYYIYEPCCEYTNVNFQNLYEIATLEFDEIKIKRKKPYINLNFFNNNGYTNFNEWDGIKYYSLQINNNLKFEFKIPTIRLYERKYSLSSSKFEIYNNPQNNYTLITLNSQVKNGSIQYLIQHR